LPREPPLPDENTGSLSEIRPVNPQPTFDAMMSVANNTVAPRATGDGATADRNVGETAQKGRRERREDDSFICVR
jgi:hypothetical protein